MLGQPEQETASRRRCPCCPGGMSRALAMPPALQGHRRELGITEESPGHETRPQISFLSLADICYCLQQGAICGGVFDSPVIPSKNIFPEGW